MMGENENPVARRTAPQTSPTACPCVSVSVKERPPPPGPGPASRQASDAGGRLERQARARAACLYRGSVNGSRIARASAREAGKSGRGDARRVGKVKDSSSTWSHEEGIGVASYDGVGGDDDDDERVDRCVCVCVCWVIDGPPTVDVPQEVDRGRRVAERAGRVRAS
ncbi:hypothetical protein PYCCODRAFT_250473 [Trametes coccinea BRFM310]|uniref:Uncharacterized protein n=1 Tax=Trametes coccinea (strain BRFM310) TaxID=1353009 RepID=A0A1Y2IPZ3_TRAC3|nr:hypothetical protein PYCCODRAFT_250473 [Trametes coccinea BRFM310]